MLTVLSAVQQVDGSVYADSGVAEGHISLNVVAPPSDAPTGGLATGSVVLNVIENKDKRVI